MQQPYDRDLSPAADGAQRSALRYAVLVALAFLVGGPVVYLAAVRGRATYTAEGSLRIEVAAPRASAPTPMRSGGSTPSDAWVELARSREVVEAAVRERRTEVRPGVDDATVRETARNLSDRLRIATDRDGGVLHLALSGSDPQEAADELNALLDAYVEVAANLKQARLDEVSTQLEAQLAAAQERLARVEHDLESFRVGTLGPGADRAPSGAHATGEAALRRDVGVAEGLYVEARRRLETARLAAAGPSSDVRVLDRASVPARPDGDPRLPMTVTIFLGCFVAVAGGALHRSLRTG